MGEEGEGEDGREGEVEGNAGRGERGAQKKEVEKVRREKESQVMVHGWIVGVWFTWKKGKGDF